MHFQKIYFHKVILTGVPGPTITSYPRTKKLYFQNLLMLILQRTRAVLRVPLVTETLFKVGLQN